MVGGGSKNNMQELRPRGGEYIWKGGVLMTLCGMSAKMYIVFPLQDDGGENSQ